MIARRSGAAAFAATVACAGLTLSGCGLHGALLAGIQPAVRIQTSPTTTGGTPTTGTSTASPSGATPSGSATATTPPAATGTTATTPPAGTGTTATTPAAGTGTTATTPAAGTGTTTTTPALPGAGKPAIELGDQNTPEQFLLGDLYRIALSDQGYTVRIDQNIGTSAISQQNLLAGTLDLYPAYLNQWLSEVAGDNSIYRTARAAYNAGEEYAVAHGMELLPPTPFNDTDGVAVTSDFSGTHDLSSLGDLSDLPAPFVFGAPLQFTVPGGGLAAIEHAYGFQPSSVAPIALGSQYDELAAGTIEAAFVQTTDWELGTGQFDLLSDPKHVLGFGNVVPVTTNAVLNAEGPDFAATIEGVSHLLTTKVMRELNADVELLGETPGDVATAFLASEGIEPPAPGP